MGLFDMFKSKKKDETEATPLAPPRGMPSGVAVQAGSGWAEKLQGYRDWDDDRKWQVAPELLAAVGEKFEDPRTKVKREDDEIELRAKLGSLPLRVQFEVDMGWVSLEMKCENKVGLFTLEWDPEKGPIERDEDEDWGDDDEGVRVFVAKGVYLEDDWSTVEESIAAIGTMPAGQVNALYIGMQHMQLSYFVATHDRVMVKCNSNFYEMNDPVMDIEAAARLMAKFARALAAGERDLASQPSVFIGGAVEIVHPQRVTCSYCQTQFPLTDAAKCPNCGASYTG